MSQDKVQYLCLVTLTSPQGERTHLIEKSPFSIGRATECDIIYPHANASRKHLEVSFESQKVFIKDLNSANGSFVNMTRLDRAHNNPIDPGDKIILGTGDIEISLRTFARPIELGSLDYQKTQMRKAMHEVISGLSQHVKEEFEGTVRKELEVKKQKSLQDIQTQVTQEYEHLRQQHMTQLEAIQTKLKTENQLIDEKIKSQQTLLENLKLQAEDILGSARNKAQELTETAHLLAEQSRKNADDLLTSSQKRAEELTTNAKLESEKLLNAAKQDSNDLWSSSKREADELLAKSKLDSHELMARARHESEDLLANSKEISEAMVTSSQKTSDELVAEAKLKLQEMRVKAHIESTEILNKAKADAEDINRTTQRQVDQLRQQVEAGLKDEIEAARKSQLSQLEQNRIDLIMEIQRLEAEIQVKSIQARTDVDKMAAQFLQESQERISKQEQETAEKVANLLRQAQTKFLETTNEAQRRSDEIQAQSRKEAAAIRKAAQEEASKTRNSAFEQADKHMQEAKMETEEHVRKLLEESSSRLQLQEQEMLKDAQMEAEKLQQEVINSHKGDIRKLKDQIEALKQESTKVAAEKDQTQIQFLNRTEDLKKVNVEFENKSTEFQSLISKIEQAETIMATAEAARQEKQVIESDIRKLQFHQDQLKAKQLERQQSQELEFKQQRDQLLVAHNDHIKALETELNQKRLRAHEELKAQIEIEEVRVKQIRKQQASELARLVEVRLADRLKVAIADARELGAVSLDIFNAVKDTLTNDEASLKPLTMHLDEAHQNVVEKRKKYSKLAMSATAAGIVLLLFLNQNSLMTYFRAQDVHSVANQMIEQRKIQSIYQPTQTTEFRESYMDNVVYMKNYYEVMSNKDFQEKWALQMNHVTIVKEMGISEEQMIKFIAIESNLVTQLFQLRQSIDAVYLSEGLERLRKLEEEEKVRMLEQIKSERNLRRVMSLQKDAINTFIKEHPGQFP